MTKCLKTNRLMVHQLAQLIRAQSNQSAVQILKDHIDQIQVINPVIWALVEERFDEALQQASRMDAQKTPTVLEKMPLWGVPYTVKEMFSISGMRSTGGLIALKENCATQTSWVVDRLNGAGAILIGTSNTAELGFGFETSNSLYGTTNNPIDIRYSAGGSSGGEGALVASFCSPIGICSDLGGSSRIPAALCGVMAFLPTRGLFPMDGHPGNHELTSEGLSSSLGWMARSARDLSLVFNVLSHSTLKKETGVPVIRYAIAPALRIRGVSPVESAIIHEMINLFQKMSHHGCAVQKVLDEEVFSDVLEIWLRQLRLGLNQTYQFAPIGTSRPATREHLHELTMNLRAKIERMTRGMDTDAARLSQAIRVFSKRFDELLGQASVLILPVFPKCALRHGESRKRPFDFAFTSIANIIGCPSAVVQIGRSEAGFPIAVQLLARPGEDSLVLAAAEGIELMVGEAWKSQG